MIGHPISRARSSAGEHYLDMVGVTGSIPVAPTIQPSQTGETVRARKEAVSAGIFDGFVGFYGLRRNQRFSWAYCGLQSPRSKIPFPAAGFPRANTLGVLQNLKSLGRRKRPACNLSWLQSEGFKLSAPLRGRIAKSLDPETAWQATFDRCPD
jgi:hypothetical protein